MAVMVTCAGAATAEVVKVNGAEVAPAGTVTLAGTSTAVLLLCKVTTMPPAGAIEVRTTEFVEEVPPPVMLVGEIVRDASCGGFTVKGRLCDTPPAAAVMVT